MGKLRDCGVFGPTSDENLNYATSNRAQWEKEGKDIVEKMLHKAETEYNAQYMEDSCRNLTPASEFVGGEFISGEFSDEQIMVRFEDQEGDLIRDDSKVADEEIVITFKE